MSLVGMKQMFQTGKSESEGAGVGHTWLKTVFPTITVFISVFPTLNEVIKSPWAQFVLGLYSFFSTLTMK
jgi:hypothetical protein